MSMPASPGSDVRWSAVCKAILRESRASRGLLFFFAGCLAIGVAAVVGVSALIGAMEGGIREQSRDLLAADLRVSARRVLPAELEDFFAGVPHERTDIRELAAMVSSGEGERMESRLVELKVIDGIYPFYGELVLDPPDMHCDRLADDRAFLAPELMLALGVELGERVRIGGADFRVAARVVDEPDRLDFTMTLGPRVFLSAAGLGRTDLNDARNRVRYRALYRLEGDVENEELGRLSRELGEALDDPGYLSIQTHDEAQPNVRSSLGRVEEYLGLVALLSLFLGGIGVSQIVRAWLAGRTRDVAVMRCFGFRAREIAVTYLGHTALLAIAGCFLGGLVGAGLPWLLRSWAPELFQGSSRHLWQPLSLLRGVGIGLVVALIFSLPPLTAVWRVSPAAVLRSEAVPLAAPRLVRFGAPVVLVLGMLLSAWVQGGSWTVAGAFSGGLFGLAALLYGAARLAMSLSARIPRGKLGPHVEHGLSAIARPGSGTAGAIVALGLGVTVVLSMYLIEGRMSSALRDSLPENAPSVFLVDVQPDQWDGVREEMRELGARSIDSVPVVMGRLREIDGRPVSELAEESEDLGRARWVFTREQRLTWMSELSETNEIVAGSLWSEPGVDEVSVEREFARDLGVEVGSTLELDVQGVPVELKVTSLRDVDWQSFSINFFLVVEPGVLEDAPHFRIAAARLDPAEAEYALQNELSQDFPNVTLMRVRPILEKIAGVLERLALGVRALGAFTILTGLVILAGAVATTALHRRREAALLKTLGVTRGGVTRLFAVEYALCGLIAGVIGAAGALVLTWAFLEQVLDLETQVAYAGVPAAALAAALLATLSGLAASWKALLTRPLETLRR